MAQRIGQPVLRSHGDRFEGAHVRAPQAVFEQLPKRHVPEFEIMTIAEHERDALTISATSIYSRQDTFAPWQLCIDATGPDSPNPRAEKLGVTTNHLALGSNLAVLAAVLDRLALPEEEWKPFTPPPGLGWLYPTPATWLADPPGRTPTSARRSATRHG